MHTIYLKEVLCRVIINFGLQCLILWSERNTKAIMSVKDTGSEEFLEFTVCPAYEHAYSDSGLAVSYQSMCTSLIVSLSCWG